MDRRTNGHGISLRHRLWDEKRYYKNFSHFHKNFIRMKVGNCFYYYLFLGVHVVEGKDFSTSHIKPLIKFRSSANTILNVYHKPSEQILMKLLYAICIPNLTYAADVIEYSVKQMHTLNVAHNDCIRRVFGYNRWESVRFLRLSFGYPSITDIFHQRSRRFDARLSTLRNDTLRFLRGLHDVV